MKINHLVFGAALAMSFLLVASCQDCITGNGNRTTREIKIGDISQIRLSGDANVLLVTDSTETLKIEGESNIIEAYEFKESGKSLKIRIEPCILHHETVTITIPVKVIESLSINGSGNFSSKKMIKASDLELNINGSGDIDLMVEAENVVSEVNGSGNIRLQGSAKNQRVQINGSGDFDSKDFAAGMVKVTINGSGDCKVLATTALHVVIRGSGSVYYNGSPDITTEVKGSGSVEKMN